MTPELQRRVQQYGWDKAASYYETGWQEQLWPAQESLLSEADVHNGEKVLDVSCGTGLVTFPMAEIVKPGGSVIGVDLSEKMIKKADQQIEKKQLGNVSFQQMDAEKLDFKDNSFDAVICSLGLMYFPFPEMALKEMYRVLKPGGRAVCLVWGERKNCGWTEIFPIVDKRVKTDVCPLFFRLGTGNTLKNAFEEAGFEDTGSNRFAYDLHFRNDEQACLAAFWGGAVALAYQKFDEATRLEADREYLDSIQKYRKEREYYVPGEFLVVEGFKLCLDRP